MRMESPSVGKRDDVIAETGKCDGRKTDTARANVVMSDSKSPPSRPTSLRRIDIAPASGDDVIQLPEPASSAIHCSWKPMEPGYSAHTAGAAVLIERTVEVEDFGHDVSNTDDADNSFRLAIPIMSRSVAVFCAVCNVLSPGLGTLIAGLSICCGSEIRLQHTNKINVIMLNTWVALLQLTTTPVFLVGWIWSIIWSIDFVSISNKHHRLHLQQQQQQLNDEEDEKNDDEPSGRRQHAVPVRRTTMTTTLSLPPASPRPPPIIVLREAPVSPHDNHFHVSPRLRRQARFCSGQLLPEVLLSPGVLENIVMHNGSVSRNNSTATSLTRTPSGSASPSSTCGSPHRRRHSSLTALD